METDFAFVTCFLTTQCFLLLGAAENRPKQADTTTKFGQSAGTWAITGEPEQRSSAVATTTPTTNTINTATNRKVSGHDVKPPFPVNASDWSRIFCYTDALIVKILKNNMTHYSSELIEAIRGHHRLVTGIYFMSTTRGYENVGNAYFNATMKAGGLSFIRIPVDTVTNFFSFNRTLQREATNKYTKSLKMWKELFKNFRQSTTTFVAPRFLY